MTFVHNYTCTTICIVVSRGNKIIFKHFINFQQGMLMLTYLITLFSQHYFPTGSKTETVVHTQVYNILLLFYYSMCITIIPNNFSIFKK